MTDPSDALLEFPPELAEMLTGKGFCTPALVIISREINRNYILIQKGLLLDEVFYSVKANNHPDLLRLLNDLGASFEVCNERELAYVVELGISTRKILFSPVFVSDRFEKSMSLVKNIVINNMRTLEMLTDCPKGYQRIFLRVKFGSNKDAIHQTTVGLSPVEVHNVAFRFKDHEIGLAIHIGSQCSAADIYTKYFENLSKLAQDLEIDINSVNLGGGYTHDLVSKNRKEFRVLHKKMGEFFPDYHISAEPGRFIVANAGYLVTRVVDKIETLGNTALRIDAGIYNGLLDLALVGINCKILTPKSSKVTSTYDIIGPTNDSRDFIAKDVCLPQQNVGDLLVIPNFGAYSTVLCTSFCQLYQPVCIVV